MDAELTSKQQAIVTCIRDYLQNHGYPPTVREIGRRVKIKSPRGVAKHLETLERKGYIERGSGLSRGIRLVGVAVGRETPIVGRIAAGSPIIAEEQIEGPLMLDAALAGAGRSFLLKVKGLSMRDAGILDGDLVLVRQQSTAEPGDIVAAILNNEATVKYFRKKKDAVHLDPANADFRAIVVGRDDQFSIAGKVVASIRIIDGALGKVIFSKH
jgi:repressor LexA